MPRSLSSNPLIPVLLALACGGASSLWGGSIEGRVTNSVTGEPVSGVEVRLLDRHSIVFQTTTDSNGAYRLEHLADGEYSAEFSKDGFQNTGAPGRSAVAGDVSPRVNAQLNPWGALRGRVLDEDGKPAAKVRVEIDARDGQTVTDENGEFAFQGVFPGYYTVLAKPQPTTRIEGGVKLGTVPVYFPSATQLPDAVPVHVDWGSDVTGIAIRLKSVPVQRLAGVVFQPDGKPAPKATVKLLGRNSAAGQVLVFGFNGVDTAQTSATVGPGPEPEIARVETREDGSFEFPAVERGDWRLSAEAGEDGAAAGQDDQPVAGVVSAVLGEQDLEGVRVRLSPPFSVPVEFEWGDAQPPKNWNGYAGFGMLSRSEGQPILNIDPAANVGKLNGIFPGRYRVMNMFPAQASYVAQVLLGGVDVLGKQVELSEGAGPLRVIMRQDTGTLRGTVENGAGSTILLFRRDVGDLQQTRATQAGSTGAFELDHVPQGDYYIEALTKAPSRYGADELNSVAQKGTSVRVETGSVATVSLRVN